MYLTCSKKLTGSQLSPPHGTNKKLKCETKDKTMIGPVQSRCHEGSPVGKRSLRWEGFVTGHYIKTENLCCLPLSSVSGSEKNWFWGVSSGSEPVVGLDHSRCSK